MKKNNRNNITDGLDILTSAKKLFIVGLISLALMVLSILGLIIFEKKKTDVLIDRINHQGVVIITNTGMLNGKTVTSFKEIARQFAIVTFYSTLNYDSTDPTPQINFMRIYATPQIFDNYRKMVLGDNTSKRYLTRAIYFAKIDTNRPIKIETIIPNKKYKITIYGKQELLTKLGAKEYPIKLELEITRNLNTGIENIFGMQITQYILTKGY